MWQKLTQRANLSLYYNLVFTSPVTRNMTKVFECYEEFMTNVNSSLLQKRRSLDLLKTLPFEKFISHIVKNFPK